MGKVIFNHVSKRYPNDPVKAVDDVNLVVEDGEFLVLVGPSGCGKSTLLRMIAGLEDITEGEILSDGRLLNFVSPKDRNIAMVFQNYALYPNMSVYENIAFGLRMRKLPKHEIHERVTRASRVLEIEPFLKRQPRNLSGGQRQRVALGRAIVREPDVFLMDEPLSNLDAKLRVQMREELIKLHRELKTTMIYVTHDQIEAMTMGSRIVIMKKGLIQQVGTPYQIYNEPANMFVAGFIGNPPMNFLEGRVIKKHDKCYFDSRYFSLLVPGELGAKLLDAGYQNKQITMGVRAETVVTDPKDLAKLEEMTFKMKIDIREYMGSDSYLYLDNTEHTMIARVDPKDVHFHEGDEITLGMDMNTVSFFDPDTEDFVC